MKRITNNVTRLFFIAILLSGSGLVVLAQDPSAKEYPKVEVFVGFSALGENPRPISFGTASVPDGYATPAGFETSVIRNFTRYVGLKADFSAHFQNEQGSGTVTVCNPICATATQPVEFRTRVFNFLAGPEFKARNSTRVTPFAHILAGVAHTSADFTTAGPPFNLSLKRSDTGFAMGLGGGLDLRVTKRVSFRGQIDYNPVFNGDSPTGGSRDFARLSFGILFH
jgi:opacity protein-like surface antigen